MCFFTQNPRTKRRSVLGQPMDAVFDQVCDEHEAHDNRKFTCRTCNQGKFDCCSLNPHEGGHQGLHSRRATSHQRSTKPQTSNVVCLNFEVCHPSPRGVRRVLHRASNQEGVPPRFSKPERSRHRAKQLQRELEDHELPAALGTPRTG